MGHIHVLFEVFANKNFIHELIAINKKLLEIINITKLLDISSI